MHTCFRYIKALFDQVRDKAEAVKENTQDPTDYMKRGCPESGHHEWLSILNQRTVAYSFEDAIDNLSRAHILE